MRIIRVEHGGTSYYGILEDGLVFRLHQQPGHMEPIPLSEAKVLPLVTPSKVVCVGLNYKAHAEELGYPLPNMPSFFLKPPSSIIGNGEPIVLPSGMGRIEHEAELAMVVGKVCRNLTPEEAEEFLEDCMAVVCDTRKEALAYLEEGMDVSGMSEEEILEAAEVFALPSGR